MTPKARFQIRCITSILAGLVLVAGCSKPAAVDVVEVRATDSSSRERFATHIHEIESKPLIVVGEFDRRGKAITVSCSTCHTTREPNASTKSGEDLNEFHQGLAMNHGKLSCLSCHNAGDYDTFHLADNTTVPWSQATKLCNQCHGPQSRDYEHGSHGGMTGYWDTTRGPRVRNNCIDCHDPHSPQFPHMAPTFKPKDRFLTAPEHPEANPHE